MHTSTTHQKGFTLVETLVAIMVLTLAYLNRLSSMLYALARLSNHKAGISEEAPDYK
jgi:prepilin-type N-terminal cleavage/methylation domain-containing protein